MSYSSLLSEIGGNTTMKFSKEFKVGFCKGFFITGCIGLLLLAAFLLIWG